VIPIRSAEIKRINGMTLPFERILENALQRMR
jgi:hypothetical protein